MNSKRFLSGAGLLPALLTAAVAAETGMHGSLEGGVGYVSDDAYRFGRYTGLQQQGAYAVGDLDARAFDEDGGYWRARGTNLGLESRYLRVEGGIRGQQQYFMEYDGIPDYRSDSGASPYLGVGSGLLTLPSGFDIDTTLAGDLQPLKIETERERIGLGTTLFAPQHWRLEVAVNHETRDGIDRIGGAIAGTPGHGGGGGGDGGGGGGIVGNTTAALLAEPIDYTTDLVDVSLQYARDRGSIDLGYHVSLFDNDERSLTWEDAFAPGVFGSQALAPDNQFHQVSLSGTYLLPDSSHLTALVSTGRMTQDEDFQAYTVNPGVATLPLARDSLDAEVWVTTAQLKLATRPLPKLRLNAEYRYDERDSNTAVNDYDVVVADAFNRPGTVENRPLSYERNQFELSANYRIGAATSLQGGYRFDDMSRDYTVLDWQDTEEDTLFVKWKHRPHEAVDLALYAEAGDRDGSGDPDFPGENPALREYYLADRERSSYGASLNYQAADNLSLGASADYLQDEYDDTEIGLTESRQPSYTLDAAWQPRENLTTHAFYTREDIDSKQSGSAAGTTTPDWKADFDDTVDTCGIGAKLTGIRGRWDVGTDLVYSRSRGEADLHDLAAPGTEVPYPDLETTLTSLKLWTQYHYRSNISLKLSYWYENYSADDWSLDHLQPDSIGNLLLLGEDTQDYHVHAFAAAISYRF